MCLGMSCSLRVTIKRKNSWNVYFSVCTAPILMRFKSILVSYLSQLWDTYLTLMRSFLTITRKVDTLLRVSRVQSKHQSASWRFKHSRVFFSSLCFCVGVGKSGGGGSFCHFLSDKQQKAEVVKVIQWFKDVVIQSFGLDGNYGRNHDSSRQMPRVSID